MCTGCLFRLGPHTIYPRLHSSKIPRMTKFASLSKFRESSFARGIREGTPTCLLGTPQTVPRPHSVVFHLVTKIHFPALLGSFNKVTLWRLHCARTSLSFYFNFNSILKLFPSYVSKLYFQVMPPTDVSKLCFQVEYDQSCPIFRELCPKTWCSGHKKPILFGDPALN